MPTRRVNRLAILAKIETTYGVNATPAAADAIIGSNVVFTPIEGQEVSRDLVLPYMGARGVVLVGTYSRIEFDVELAGAGDAGDVPRYAALLRAAGMSQTIDADTEVVYQIIEEAVPSLSLYYVLDKVQPVLLGCQCSVSFSISPGAIPRFRVTAIGMLGTITDVGTMPVVSQAGWITPLVASKANTTLTLHGWPAVAESLSIDLGNTLTPRFLIGDERMLISNRVSTGTAVVEARSLAEINWFQRALDRTRGVLTLVHGKTAGNIVEIEAGAVEVGKPTQGETDGIANYSLPLTFVPVNGLDEIKLTIR